MTVSVVFLSKEERRQGHKCHVKGRIANLELVGDVILCKVDRQKEKVQAAFISYTVFFFFVTVHPTLFVWMNGSILSLETQSHCTFLHMIIICLSDRFLFSDQNSNHKLSDNNVRRIVSNSLTEHHNTRRYPFSSSWDRKRVKALPPFEILKYLLKCNPSINKLFD